MGLSGGRILGVSGKTGRILFRIPGQRPRLVRGVSPPALLLLDRGTAVLRELPAGHGPPATCDRGFGCALTGPVPWPLSARPTRTPFFWSSRSEQGVIFLPGISGTRRAK